MQRIKICCISSVQEARTAISEGAHALGLVSEMPSGPGTIDDRQIAEIAKVIPPGVASFLLTARQDVAGIIQQHRVCATNTIQLVDRVEKEVRQELRRALPGVGIVQVVHVMDEGSVAEAVAAAESSDAVLLDSGNPNLGLKELGGTGRTHDWSLSAKIVARLAVPVFLAGGLNPQNVQDAVREVKPYGLDLCSGVRTHDRLDPAKLKRFMTQLK